MSDSILRDKSKEFAKEIVFLCRRLKQNNVESALINQLLRSGTFGLNGKPGVADTALNRPVERIMIEPVDAAFLHKVLRWEVENIKAGAKVDGFICGGDFVGHSIPPYRSF